LNDFDYIAVKSLPEAIQVLSIRSGEAKILAGGTDLLVQMRAGRLNPSLLLDIKSIPEANILSYHPTVGLRIGAALPIFQLRQSELLRQHYPGVLDAISLIGGVQIQGRATLGGNLCNASPAADSIPALIVHRTQCVIAGPLGQRQVPVESFCTAPGRTVLAADELLLSLSIPPPEAHFGAAYLRFIPRNEMDIAVAGVGASLVLDESLTRILSARIALAAVSPRPLLVAEVGAYLSGCKVSTVAFAEAAQIARQVAQPIDDMRGTTAQRAHLVAVLTRRALDIALERACV
jgi:CO/xanthine dehydrogenase FAD-binding subunit